MQTGPLTAECALLGCQINSKLKKESNQQQIKWLLKAHGVNIQYSQVVIAIEIDRNVIRKMKWEASQLPSSVRHRPQGTTKYSVNFQALLERSHIQAGKIISKEKSFTTTSATIYKQPRHMSGGGNAGGRRASTSIAPDWAPQSERVRSKWCCNAFLWNLLFAAGYPRCKALVPVQVSVGPVCFGGGVFR